MKKTLIALFLLANGCLFAQKNPYGVVDDLLKGKEESLAKFVPMSGGQFLFSGYQIDPPEYLQKIDQFKKSLQPAVDAETDPVLKELKAKDLDYYARNVVKHYMMYYGLDSAAMMNLEKLMIAKKGAKDYDEAIQEAFKKMYLKKLDSTGKALLNEKVMEGTNLNEAALFKRSAAYRQWMDSYIGEIRFKKYGADTSYGYEGQNLVKLRIVSKEIADPFIKEYLSYNLAGLVLKMMKVEKGREEAYQTFMSIASNDEVKEDLRRVHENNKLMESNGLSPEFSFVSIDNKKVSLKDLRGKYVYIDVWATWCGPCKAEIPHLQKVEKDYHGKNICFVSLSVDRQSDKSKWEKYVKENKLGGIQLIADKDFDSEFIQKYNIAAIPRFILIDPDGKIVSGNALRPSDPGLREQLNKLL